jgi:hypothetical protein
MKDSAGHDLTGCTSPAIDLLERACFELRCYVDDPVATVDAALAVAPELVMGHVLRAYLHLLGTEPVALPVARESWERAAALPCNERERHHVRAVQLLCDGQWRAAGRTLEDLSVDYPLDGLALQAGHLIDFYTGDSRMLRDRMARVFPQWSKAVTGYHAFLGMYAFGLEETGDYAIAERLARQAIDLQPRDGWAQHAAAHVMEMQGRRLDGIEWMRARTDWSVGSFFAVHNWWHLALYHLELGEIDEVLKLFDGPINGHRSAVLLDLIDASALLWRLQLRGVPVGDRWESLADRWAPVAGAGNYAFNDMHAAMAFANTGRDDLVEQVRQAQAQALTRADDNADFTREVGAPATQAMIAFVAGDYATTTTLLRPLRQHAHRFGGSHAQRDLIDQTIIAAAERSGQDSLAHALRTEREMLAGQRASHAVHA